MGWEKEHIKSRDPLIKFCCKIDDDLLRRRRRRRQLHP